MKKLLFILLVLAFYANSASAGYINIVPGQWATFNSADTNCSKTTKANLAGDAVYDVISCSEGDEFQVSTTVPQNADTTTGTGWNATYIWTCESCTNAQVACLQASHIVCIGAATGADACQDLDFAAPPTNPATLDVTTAEIDKMILDTESTFLGANIKEGPAADNCTTSACDGQPINLRFEFTTGTVGDCTTSFTGDIDIARIIVEYPED